MRYALLLIVVVGILSCDGNGPPPPPPPPPPTTTIPLPPPPCGENESCQCIEGYERNDEGDCVEIPPPPPPPPVKPEDYVTIVRAGELGETDASGNHRCVTGSGLLKELCFDEQKLIWDGIRHPDFALGHCCAALPGPWELNVTSECVSPEVEANRWVYLELAGFIKRLQETNKRCKPSHPEYDEAFCDHTNVNKDVFKAWREGSLRPAIEISGRLNGIKSWCVNQ